MALDGVILDLDGTLVDTNALHVEAWRLAFEHCGYVVPADRIFQEIGKGGDFVVPSLLGEKAEQKHGETLRKAQPVQFTKLAKAGIRQFPGARDLLVEIRNRSLQLILATSSAAKQLEVIERASGLNVRELVDRRKQSRRADDRRRAKNIQRPC